MRVLCVGMLVLRGLAYVDASFMCRCVNLKCFKNTPSITLVNTLEDTTANTLLNALVNSPANSFVDTLANAPVKPLLKAFVHTI